MKELYYLEDEQRIQHKRVIGTCSITGGFFDSTIRVQSEEGPYDAGCYDLAIEASHKGYLYYYTNSRRFESQQELNEFIDSLPDDFDPYDDEDWHYGRTIYGGEAWTQQDEIAMMSDEERFHHGF